MGSRVILYIHQVLCHRCMCGGSSRAHIATEKGSGSPGQSQFLLLQNRPSGIASGSCHFRYALLPTSCFPLPGSSSDKADRTAAGPSKIQASGEDKGRQAPRCHLLNRLAWLAWGNPGGPRSMGQADVGKHRGLGCVLAGKRKSKPQLVSLGRTCSVSVFMG